MSVSGRTVQEGDWEIGTPGDFGTEGQWCRGPAKRARDLSPAARAYLDEADQAIARWQAVDSLGDAWLIDPAHWDAEPPAPINWLVEGWLSIGSAALLTGAGSVGKSLLAQILCTCTALGRPFLGKPTQQRNAIYITCEDDADVLGNRQNAINRALGVSNKMVGQALRLMSLKGLPDNWFGAADDRGGFQYSERFRSIMSFAWSEMNAGLIALDNVGHLFIGNENARRDVAQFMGALDGWASRSGACVLLLAHPSKAGAEYSGSTGWDAYVRHRLFMDWLGDDEGGDPDMRVLKSSKANYGQRGDTITMRWHAGTFVLPTEMGKVGEEIAAVARANRDDDLFLACLDERNRQQRPVSERPSATYAPTVFAKMPESRGIGKPRLQAAMDRLFRQGLIERGFVYRDTAEGKDKQGIRRPADHPLTPSHDDRQPLTPTSADDRQHSPLPTVIREAPSPQREGRDPFKDDDWQESDAAPLD